MPLIRRALGHPPATPADATWLHSFYDHTFWMTPGGDFVKAASATQSVSGISFYTWGPTAGMLSDVQGWFQNPSTNFGWIIIGNEDSAGTTKRFDSRENPEPSYRPMLTVEFALLLPNEVFLPVIIND